MPPARNSRSQIERKINAFFFNCYSPFSVNIWFHDHLIFWKSLAAGPYVLSIFLRDLCNYCVIINRLSSVIWIDCPQVYCGRGKRKRLSRLRKQKPCFPFLLSPIKTDGYILSYVFLLSWQFPWKSYLKVNSWKIVSKLEIYENKCMPLKRRMI